MSINPPRTNGSSRVEMTVELRKFTVGDVDSLVAIANDKAVWDNMRDAFPSPCTDKEARSFIERATATDAKEILRAVIYNGKHVGNIGIHPQEDVYKRSAEIGYFIGKDYWGRGIASEAIRQMVELAFNELDVVRIFAGVYDYNLSSKRVLEKNGFQLEGIAKKAIYKNNELHDEYRYALIKNTI